MEARREYKSMKEDRYEWAGDVWCAGAVFHCWIPALVLWLRLFLHPVDRNLQDTMGAEWTKCNFNDQEESEYWVMLPNYKDPV